MVPLGCAVRDSRDHHAARADWRLRGDAFTVGRYGVASSCLGQLVAAVYIACLLFIVVGWSRGSARRLQHIPVPALLGEEIRSCRHLVVRVGAAAPHGELEHVGCSKPVVGLVVPAGYSFNLDGTAVYMARRRCSSPQASHVELTLRQESHPRRAHADIEGAAAVTGSGFVTLAATLARSRRFRRRPRCCRRRRFMSEARAITN